MNLRAAIRELYTQVQAPEWAAPNLDALADVLRDLSWLPLGPVDLNRPHLLTAGDARRLGDVLDQAMAETAGGPRPVHVRESGEAGGPRDAH
jgi:hypothetical protein